MASAAFDDIVEPDDQAVTRRLADLGVPPELLAESARIGYQLGDFTTAAHPRTYPGTVVWGEITAALRTGLSRLGWELDDTDNIARAISPDESVTVVAVRGNECTGLRNKHEKLNTRRPRGSAGVQIVRVNAQLSLPGMEVGEEEVVALGGGTWFFLYERSGEVVRSELAFAKAVSDSGNLLFWKERLILPDIDLSQEPPTATGGNEPPQPPEVDVPITRRAI